MSEIKPPKPNFQVPGNELSHISHVIGVVSGKGGVGKSTVTANLAVSLRRKGYSVGILDADITGPSIPKMFGIRGQAKATEKGAYPIESESGIKVMSINLLLDDEEQPVVWRGPIIAGTVKQFWTDVIWGDLDYLLVDMPPGTGDVPLTVFQSLPLDGIMIVTSPQDLVSMIVKKAVNMAKMMDIKVIGVIENYSYVLCPNCGEKIYPFGESHLDKYAAAEGLKVLGSLPIDRNLAELADKGEMDKADVTLFDGAVSALEK
jgi:Mrp family chromosome partitioning ATPase